MIDMDRLDELIEYENEHSGLDFKAIQYTREKYENFIKDIMSMANADIGEEGYIIIGVKLRNSTERDILGISKEDFIDSATYQQIISENIEPDINIEYTAYLFESKYLGILKISQCNDQPYMMKKDFGKLKRGDCFIRKGSFQPKMTRQDFDRIMAKKISEKKFEGKVNIYFSGYAHQEITLSTAQDVELSSKREADKLQNLINEEKDKQLLIAIQNSDANIYGTSLSHPLSTPKEERRIEGLERDLKNVKNRYKDDDLYEFYELRSHKLNITIMNEGTEYIEDALMQIDIDKADGLTILEKIYYPPNYERDKLYSKKNHYNDNFLIGGLGLSYPRVEDRGTYIRIHNGGGLMKKWDIKHQIPEEAFWEPVRFLFLKDLAGHTVQLKCKLFGKNLEKPIETILRINVVPNDGSQ